MRYCALACLFFCGPVFSSDLACSGKPLSKLDLAQFGAEKNQGSEGTCFSFASTSNVEAALFRRTGEHKRLIEEFTTMAHCTLESQERASALITTGTTADSDETGVYDGGSTRISTASLLNQGELPLHSEARAKEMQKIYDASRVEHVNLLARIKSELLIKKAHSRIAELKIRLDRLERDEKATSDEVDSLSKQINAITANLELHQEAGARKICRNFSECLAEMKKVKGPKIDVTSLTPFTKDYPDPCDDESAGGDARLDDIIKSLCLGVPASLSISDPHSLMSVSEGKWVESKSSPDPNGGRHAVVARGMEVINNKPYLILENSWGKDGRLALPFDQACRIKSATQVFNMEVLAGESVDESTAFANEGASKELAKARIKKGWIQIEEVKAAKKSTKMPEGGSPAKLSH
jgi:hypothetical protein